LLIIIAVTALVVFNTLGLIFGAPFAPTPHHQLKSLFKKLKLGKKDVVYDLGFGDGRILIQSAQCGASAVGFEINPYLYLLGNWNIKRSGQSTRVHLHLGNFWNHSLKEASVIFVFILPQYTKKLEKKLKSEARSGTQVITYLISLPTYKPIKSFSGFNIYIF